VLLTINNVPRVDWRLQWRCPKWGTRTAKRYKSIYGPGVHKNKHWDLNEHENGGVARQQAREQEKGPSAESQHKTEQVARSARRRRWKRGGVKCS